MTPQYAIGDIAWLASWTTTTTWVTCPDCGGQKAIRCILYDDSEVSIECSGCRRGYEPPAGVLQSYTSHYLAAPVCISGMEITPEGCAYRSEGHYSMPAENLFPTQEEAEARAKVLAAEHDAAERARLLRREKDTRTWAWHVHYHRKGVRDAEKQLAYHTSQLAVARVKAKEPAV